MTTKQPLQILKRILHTEDERKKVTREQEASNNERRKDNKS
jgi:hypothetical protein